MNLLQNPALWLQWTVVILLVLASAVYSTWRLLPTTQRLRLVNGLLPVARRAHWQWPQKMRAQLLAQAAQTCGGCGGGRGAHKTHR